MTKLRLTNQRRFTAREAQRSSRPLSYYEEMRLAELNNDDPDAAS